ncbi:MAG: hypothetical protein RI918_749 [Pseudomonadota bacterium]|jgi:hypothetical protein
MKSNHRQRPSLVAYLWVLPVTLFGLFFALIAYWLGASVKQRLGVLEVAGNTRTPLLRALSNQFDAITIGHVILGRNHGTLKRWRDHEHIHVRQYERWGLLFPMLYILASFQALCSGKRFYWDNVFEIEARRFQ